MGGRGASNRTASISALEILIEFIDGDDYDIEDVGQVVAICIVRGQ